MPELGFVTMAFGHKRYFRQAENMGLSLKRHMSDVPLALVTDRIVGDDLFDVVIPMKHYSRAGTIHKLDLYDYSPFEETLFIDSDCIATRPFSAELIAIRQYDFTPVVGRYLHCGDTDPWLIDLAFALDHINGLTFPKFNGGIYFFKKSNATQLIIRRANELRTRATELGIKDFDRAGPGDETLIGLALAELKVPNLHNDHGNLMRTPVDIIGKLQVDALGGGCSFNKGGVFVSPAICHFPVEWLLTPEYKIAEHSLRKGHPPRAARKLSITAQYHLGQFRQRLKRKLSSTFSELRLSSHVTPSH